MRLYRRMLKKVAFSDITGQEQAVNILKKALDSGRLAHSLLFSGPEGTGKRLAALALAMELNCGSPESGHACGKCAGCRQISKSAHPDVSIIAPEGKALEIKIDAIRAMRREMHLKPVGFIQYEYLIPAADRLDVHFPAHAAHGFYFYLERFTFRDDY